MEHNSLPLSFLPPDSAGASFFLNMIFVVGVDDSDGWVVFLFYVENNLACQSDSALVVVGTDNVGNLT